MSQFDRNYLYIVSEIECADSEPNIYSAIGESWVTIVVKFVTFYCFISALIKLQTERHGAFNIFPSVIVDKYR